MVISTSQVAAWNRLVALHNRSLAVYLRDARPWRRSPAAGGGDEQAAALVLQIAADHSRVVQLATAELESVGAPVTAGEFPMTFTDLHDLTYSFLVRTLIAEERGILAACQSIARELPGDPLPQEAVGLAKGHLESLQEVTTAAAH